MTGFGLFLRGKSETKGYEKSAWHSPERALTAVRNLLIYNILVSRLFRFLAARTLFLLSPRFFLTEMGVSEFGFDSSSDRTLGAGDGGGGGVTPAPALCCLVELNASVELVRSVVTLPGRTFHLGISISFPLMRANGTVVLSHQRFMYRSWRRTAGGEKAAAARQSGKFVILPWKELCREGEPTSSVVSPALSPRERLLHLLHSHVPEAPLLCFVERLRGVFVLYRWGPFRLWDTSKEFL